MHLFRHISIAKSSKNAKLLSISAQSCWLSLSAGFSSILLMSGISLWLSSNAALGQEIELQMQEGNVAEPIPPSIDADSIINPEPFPQLNDALPQEEPPKDFLQELLRGRDELPEIRVLPAPITETQCIQKFEIDGNTVFSEARLQDEIEDALNDAKAFRRDESDEGCPGGRVLSFSQVLLAPTAITAFYLENDYPTSGALIQAEATVREGVVPITVVEGRLEDIQVSGTDRLNSSYISNRLWLAGAEPLNRKELLEGLQLLQLNPLIETVEADLQAGTLPGTNLLLVKVKEFEDTSDVTVSLSNSRSPSVGSFRRDISFSEANLLGLGDSLSVGYVNTTGSNALNASYELPISPENVTLSLAASVSESRVTEDQFEVLGIQADSSSYSVSLKRPVFQAPQNQFDVELTLSRQYSQTFLGLDDIGPFPLSAGADDQGRSVSSALRFAQTWVQRTPKQGIALRSQFSVGLHNFLGGTVNDSTDIPAIPDNDFFVWQGQGQWARQIDDDGNNLFLLRGNVQLAANPLLSAERFGLGGQSTVRGYRQQKLLTDSGVQASAEMRFRVFSGADEAKYGIFRVAPFIDFGHGWNVNGNSADPNASNTLLGIGSGFIWERGDFDARIDFGIPLIDGSEDGDSLQDSGVYFSVQQSFL